MKQRMKDASGEFVAIEFSVRGEVCSDPDVAARVMRAVVAEKDADITEVTFRNSELVGLAHVPEGVDVTKYRDEFNARMKSIVEAAIAN